MITFDYIFSGPFHLKSIQMCASFPNYSSSRLTNRCLTASPKRHQQLQQARWWKNQKRSSLPLPSQPRRSHLWVPRSQNRGAWWRKRAKRSTIDWLKRSSKSWCFLHLNVSWSNASWQLRELPVLLVDFFACCFCWPVIYSSLLNGKPCWALRMVHNNFTQTFWSVPNRILLYM